MRKFVIKREYEIAFMRQFLQIMINIPQSEIVDQGNLYTGVFCVTLFGGFTIRIVKELNIEKNIFYTPLEVSVFGITSGATWQPSLNKEVILPTIEFPADIQEFIDKLSEILGEISYDETFTLDTEVTVQYGVKHDQGYLPIQQMLIDLFSDLSSEIETLRELYVPAINAVLIEKNRVNEIHKIIKRLKLGLDQ